MAETLHETPLEFLGEAEKAYAFFARMLDELGNIRAAVEESAFPIDMYGDDPAGTFGIIAQPFKPGGSAQIFTNYNGPFIIDSILATWSISGPPTSVTLQLKDRTFQFPPSSGIQNPQALAIQMDRDDQIILTVSPKAACHLEIMGHVDKRKRDYLS